MQLPQIFTRLLCVPDCGFCFASLRSREADPVRPYVTYGASIACLALFVSTLPPVLPFH